MRISMKAKSLMIVMALIISASFANAEISTNVKNDVGQQQANQNNLTFGDNYGSTEMINPTKLDSNVNVPLSPFMNEGWKIWALKNKKTFGINQIEALRNSSYGLDREVRFWQTREKQNNEILILPREVVGFDTVSEMGYVKVITHKPDLLEGVIHEALYLAVKEGKINNALVLVRGKFITNGKVRSLGGFGGGGSPIGSATDPSKIIVSGAIGSGIGSSQAWVDEGFEVKIVSYDSIPPAYFASLKSETNEVDNKTIIKTAENTPKNPTTNFDTDEHMIKDALNEYPEKQDQIKNVYDIAAGLNNDWPNLIANKTTIWFIGSADERGTEEYNAYLGLKRGRETALTVAKLLVNKYNHDPEEVVNIIKYASTGENNPISNEYKKNRVVYIVRGEIISNLN